jgi:hypothetical protein
MPRRDRLSFTARRRARLSVRVASLEAMESRNLITESLGIYIAGIGIPAAQLLMAKPEANASRFSAHAPRSHVQIADPIPFQQSAQRSAAPAGGSEGTKDRQTIALPSLRRVRSKDRHLQNPSL